MADTAAASKSPKKKVTKPKKPATHPKYSEMVQTAISSLKERGGSSRQAILKYIMANFNLGTTDAKLVNARVKVALRGGVKSNALKQSKGTGATGSFRLGVVPKVDKPKKAKKPKAAAAKPKKAKTPKKIKTPKKAAGEKKAAKPKKAKTPKKAPAKTKKAKTPTKKPKAAAKPKKTKTPKKKPAAKPKKA